MAAQGHTSWDELSSDGEEIVYLDSVVNTPSVASEAGDGDYILVPHLGSPSMHTIMVPRAGVLADTSDQLTSALAALSLSPAPVLVPIERAAASKVPAQTKAGPRSPATPKRKKRRDNNKPAPKTTSPVQLSLSSAYPSPPTSPAPQSRRSRKHAVAKAQTKAQDQSQAQISTVTGLGARNIVDDISELGDDEESKEYADAHSYIASHLANPPPVLTNGMLLPLLQALIVELGLSAPEQKPRSVTAAKGLLKSRAFINVREYLTARDAGQEAIQRAMHPSRTSLVRALRKGSATRAPRDWVKKSGLSVLLVKL